MNLGLTLQSDVTFGDNTKAIFGAGSDLQIYHDGTHSRIVDAALVILILQQDDLRMLRTATQDTWLDQWWRVTLYDQRKPN